MHPSFVAQFPLFMRGVVSKAKAMQKTVTVMVPRRAVDKLTRKDIIKHTKFLVHDEKEICNVQDVVRIASTRRLSKRKHYEVERIEHRAERIEGSAVRPPMMYRGFKLGPMTREDRAADTKKQMLEEAKEKQTRTKEEWEKKQEEKRRMVLEQAQPREPVEGSSPVV